MEVCDVVAGLNDGSCDHQEEVVVIVSKRIISRAMSFHFIGDRCGIEGRCLAASWG